MNHGDRVGNKVFLQPLGVEKMLGFCDDMSITLPLLHNRVFELPMANFFIRHIKEGMTLVDIGANIGYFSLMAGARVGKTGKVYAYEASPVVHKLLEENIKLNDLGNIILAEHKAIYSENTMISFHQCNIYQGNSSVFQHSEEYRNRYHDTFTEYLITARKLDSELLPVYIDYVKIDIEGGEYQAFKGMKELLDSKRIGHILYEYNKFMLKERDELKEFLSQYNADYYVINNDGSTRQITFEEAWRHDSTENDNVLMAL